MTKLTDKEYLLRLDLALSSLPFEEREEAIEFVQELFVEAFQEGTSSDSIMDRLGNPEMYAQKILESFNSPISPPPIPAKTTSALKKTYSWGKMVFSFLIMIFAIPLVFGLLLVILGLFLSLFMVFLSLIVAFISGIFAAFIVFGKGIYLIGHDPLGAVFDLGATLFAIGLTWLLGNLVHWIFKIAWPRTLHFFKKQESFFIQWIHKKRRSLQ